MNPNSQTRPEPPTPQRGPERFAAPVVTPEEPSPLRVAGAALALALLILGVPLALWGLTGAPPVPTSVPTREDLTQPLSLDAILVVLRVVVWLAWLQFTVCTTVEVASLVRGGGLPRPVPLSGRSQALARMLVGTVLVGSSVIGTATAASATPGDLHAHGEQRASATPAAVAEQRDTPKLDRATEAPDGARAESDRAAGVPDHAGVPADMHDVVGRKVAIVKPPQGHYHDNLWDIAERHLGDGRRWKEIFDLNQARQQPDGQQLVLGRLIQPGWVLVMPEDAVGVDRVTQAPSGPRSGGRPHQQAGSTQLEALRHADQHADQHGYHDGYQADATSELPRDLLGGGLLAAAALMVLAGERSRRRGVDPTDDELEAEIALRVGADTDRVVWLDQALRGLSASCRAERIPLPAVYALTVSDEAIELRMAPGQPHAPAPWTPLEEGRRWRLTRDAHPPLEMGNAPYPGLVCLGRDADGADALIDLESIGGLVAFTGSPTVANEVVSAIAVQLATAPWSDERTVHGYHLSPVLTDIDGDRLRDVTDLLPLVREMQGSHPQRAGHDVLTGRLARQPGIAPEYLVLGSRPDEEMIERLNHLTRSDARGFGVVAVGDIPGTRWRLTVDESGHLSLPLLGLEVTAVRLTEESGALVAGLFTKARTTEPSTSGTRVAIAAPPRPGDDAHWSAAPVRVGVLGPIEVRAAGVLDPARLALATEVATFLALQPGPVHANVLAASIWPRGVTPEVRDATIARVRDWLGKDPEGNHLLRENDEGRLYLADDVAVDWHAFCQLALRARSSGPGEEVELLRRALQLIRGPLLVNRPASRYSWLPRTRMESQSVDVVVDTAHRLARLCGDDDPGGAAAAATAGLRFDPGSQLLWRDLLVAESLDPVDPDTAGVVDQLLGTLQSIGAPLEAETEALIEELLPARKAREQA